MGKGFPKPLRSLRSEFPDFRLLRVLHLHDEVVALAVCREHVDDALLVVLVLGRDLGVEEGDVHDVDVLDDAVEQPDGRRLEPLRPEDSLEREIDGRVGVDVLCLHCLSVYLAAKLRRAIRGTNYSTDNVRNRPLRHSGRHVRERIRPQNVEKRE